MSHMWRDSYSRVSVIPQDQASAAACDLRVIAGDDGLALDARAQCRSFFGDVLLPGPAELNRHEHLRPEPYRVHDVHDVWLEVANAP